MLLMVCLTIFGDVEFKIMGILWCVRLFKETVLDESDTKEVALFRIFQLEIFVFSIIIPVVSSPN